MNENIQRPFTRTRMSFQTRRMEKLRREVTAEGTPCGAVEGSADIMLVTSNDFDCFHDGETIGEDGAVLDQSMVRNRVAGYENGRGVTKVKGHNWAIFGMVMAKGGFKLRQRFEKPNGIAYKWQRKRTRRKFLLPAMGNIVQKYVKDCTNGKGNESYYQTIIIHSSFLLSLQLMISFTPFLSFL